MTESRTHETARAPSNTTERHQNNDTMTTNDANEQHRTDGPMTDRDTPNEQPRRDVPRQKMKEMDHTPPVEGARRVFERDDEGTLARPDGGTRREDPSEGDEPSNEESEADGPSNEKADADEDEDEDARRFRQKMKEMDHTPPVSGPNRTFERGNESVPE